MYFREEPKQDNDLDDPWIMTVKGNTKLPSEEPPATNHKPANKVQNGSGPVLAKSPPKDSNLNHYRPEKATPVSYILFISRKSFVYIVSICSLRNLSRARSRPPTTGRRRNARGKWNGRGTEIGRGTSRIEKRGYLGN